MQTKTKQRWVGFLILLAILALFLPLVFHNRHPSLEVQSTLKVPPKQAVDIAQQTPEKEHIALRPSSRTVLSRPVPHFMATPEAWCVQLATLSNIDHANALVKKLREKGFDAYMRPILNANGNRLLRVYVGPEIQKERALQLREILKASFRLNGIVQKYKVKTLAHPMRTL